MSLPKVVSRAEWLTARKELLEQEKELTRRRDALSAERRRLPMVEIDKDYVFTGPDGEVGAARPVRGPAAADPLPLHVRPRAGRRAARAAPPAPTRCPPGCMEHLAHPRHHDTCWCRARRSRSSSPGRRSRAGRSRGTRRTASDFNYDFGVTIDESRAPLRIQLPRHGRARRAGTWLRRRAAREARARASSCASTTVSSTRTRRSRAARSGPAAPTLPRPHGARAPGGLGGAEGPLRERAGRDARLRR